MELMEPLMPSLLGLPSAGVGRGIVSAFEKCHDPFENQQESSKVSIYNFLNVDRRLFRTSPVGESHDHHPTMATSLKL
jgi:hypothetical protein